MDRFLFIILCVALVFGAVSYLLGRIFKRKSFIKYILPILTFGISAYFFYISIVLKKGTGFEDLANLLLAMILLAGGLAGFLTSLIMDLRSRGRY